MMLHPRLGWPSDPLATWHVDTPEIDDLVGLYDRHLSSADDPEQLSRRLGMLWKKLATAPRLASLLVDYVNLRLHADPAREEGGRDVSWVVEKVGLFRAALGRTSRRPQASPRLVYAEDDPLYDQWIDA